MAAVGADRECFPDQEPRVVQHVVQPAAGPNENTVPYKRLGLPQEKKEWYNCVCGAHSSHTNTAQQHTTALADEGFDSLARPHSVPRIVGKQNTRCRKEVWVAAAPRALRRPLWGAAPPTPAPRSPLAAAPVPSGAAVRREY